MSVSTISSARAERRAELLEQVARPRVTVRLEHDDDAAIEPGARRGDDGGDFRRVMAVVVDHHDAADFAAQLEPPLGATELFEAARQSSANGSPTSRPTATAPSAFSRL